MSTPVWTRDEIDSPCIQICVVHPETRLCTGCNRSIDEITKWSKMTPETRASNPCQKGGAVDARRGLNVKT